MDNIEQRKKSALEVPALLKPTTCKGCKWLKPGYFGGYCRFFDKPTSGKLCDSYK